MPTLSAAGFSDLISKAEAAKKPEDKIRYYSAAIKENPNHPEPFAQRARLRLALGEYNEAESDALKAVSLDKKFPAPYYVLGETYFQKSKHDEAVAAFSKVIRMSPSCDAYMARARVYDAMGLYQEELEDLHEASKIEPDNTQPYHKRARMYYRMKQYDKAYAEFNIIAVKSQKDPISINNRGFMALWAGKYAAAKKDFDTAIALEPIYPAAYVNLADYYMAAKKDRVAALKALRKALEQGYKDTDNWADPKADGHFLGDLIQSPEYKAMLAEFAKCRKK